MRSTLKYWPLSAFYGTYYLVLGAFSPYFGPFLTSRGFSAFDLSLVMSAWYAARVFAPPGWSLVIRRSSDPIRWLRLGAAATLVAFSAYWWTHNLFWMLAIMLVFASAYNSILPQFEALALSKLGKDRADYGRIRVWGSIGFVIANLSFGSLLSLLGYGSLILAMLPCFLLLLIATWLNEYPKVAPHLQDIASITSENIPGKAKSGLISFFAAAILMQAAHGAFYVFYSVHLDKNGYDARWIGGLWATGVLAEIAMFLWLPKILSRLGAHKLMTWCFAAGCVRWILTAELPQYPWVMMAAQLTHALTFAAFHGACMHRIADYYPAGRATHGQALLFGLSSGVGGVAGAWLAGALWMLGSGSASFLGAAVVSALGFWLMWREREVAAVP